MDKYIPAVSFSPRNGEVILKSEAETAQKYKVSFQSPQWGSNSKVGLNYYLEVIQAI